MFRDPGESAEPTGWWWNANTREITAEGLSSRNLVWNISLLLTDSTDDRMHPGQPHAGFSMKSWVGRPGIGSVDREQDDRYLIPLRLCCSFFLVLVCGISLGQVRVGSSNGSSSPLSLGVLRNVQSKDQGSERGNGFRLTPPSRTHDQAWRLGRSRANGSFQICLPSTRWHVQKSRAL